MLRVRAIMNYQDCPCFHLKWFYVLFSLLTFRPQLYSNIS